MYSYLVLLLNKCMLIVVALTVMQHACVKPPVVGSYHQNKDSFALVCKDFKTLAQ